MSGFPELMTREGPPQNVLIRQRIKQRQLAKLLAAHARFRAAERNGRRAVLLRCDLSNLDLGGIDLSGADLIECDLSGSDLSNAKLSRATLVGCCFAESNLNGADLSGANLSGADFADTDLRGADLSEAVFFGAKLRHAEMGESPSTGLPTKIDTRMLDRLMMQRKGQ